MAALPRSGTVISADGVQGRFEAEPAGQDTDRPRVRVKFPDGRQLLVAADELIAQAQDRYLLPLRLEALKAAETLSEVQVIPVIAETLDVTKRQVETGRVRVTKIVQEIEETVDEPLLREELDVQRVAVNRFVDSPTTPRYDNDTVIVPLFEEVLVVEKRLLLREELHISRRRTIAHQPQTVVRRSEEVLIERLQPPPSETDAQSAD